MNRQQLDKIDIQILQKLGEDGRKPYLEIARELGVSGAAIHQRLQRLTAKGVVNGTECQINPASLGYETCAYIGIFLNDPPNSPRLLKILKRYPRL